MKKLLLYIGAGILLLSACHDLNLNPLSSGSTENWYSTETEVQMAVDELYRYDFWPEDGQQQTDWSDDYTSRDLLTSFDDGTLNDKMLGLPVYGAISTKLFHVPMQLLRNRIVLSKMAHLPLLLTA